MATSTIEQEIVLRGDSEADCLIDILSAQSESDYQVKKIDIENEMKEGLRSLKRKFNR